MKDFILKTHDGESIRVTADQAEAIHNLLNAGHPSIKVNRPGGGVYYLARGNYKGMDEHKEPLALRPGGPPKALEISDEKRQANIRRLRQMKQDFMIKHSIK